MYYDNKRLALSLFWLVLGAVLAGLSVAGVVDSSLYAGMGGAMMAVGGLRLLTVLRYRQDPAYREEIDTAAADERNRFLRMKSWSWTGYLTVLIQGIGVIVATVLGNQQWRTMLSCSVCLILVLYWVSYLLLSRKY